MMHIELACIGSAGATVTEYALEAPATVGDVLQLAGLEPAVVGIFGRIVSRQHLLADGDRVEIYRGAAIDAKAARRARAGRDRR